MEVVAKLTDNQLFLVTSGGACVCASVVAVLLSWVTGVFLLGLYFATFYIASYFAKRQIPVRNFLRGFIPPTTVLVRKSASEDVWVPSDIDEALERLYERIVREFVESWYTEVSPECDEEFLQEIRHLLKDATENIINRVAKVDLTRFILSDVIPVALQHLDTYLWVCQHHQLQNLNHKKTVCPSHQSSIQADGRKCSCHLHKTWVEFAGTSVQPVLLSRKAEAEYLETLSAKLLPLVLTKKVSQSRLGGTLGSAALAGIIFQPLLDLLTSPKTINFLLRQWFSPEPIEKFGSCQDPPVRLLTRFLHVHNQPKPSALHVDLSAVMKNQTLLYQFIQFLKNEGGINLLQFCLAVEDFNKRMMVIDLSDEDMASLHEETETLFKTYIKSNAPHFINFEDEIVRDIGEVVRGHPRQIEKLRTTPPLFRAYEQVFNNLEDNYCPRFLKSDEYFGFVLGKRLSEMKDSSSMKNVSNNKSPGHSMKRRLSKIKHDVMGGGTLEGSPEPDLDNAYDLADYIEEGEDEEEEICARDDVCEFRDLSAWRVMIPRLEARTDAGKACFVFIIQVQRIDVTSRKDGADLEWTVERQYHEFYSLQSALVQYHGVFEDAKLPPRSKLFGGKGLDVLQSKLEPFQDYLINLLLKPSLRKSELLYTFLTSAKEFSEATSQVDLSRMIKNVPMKLQKERGQFLQSFISTFVASTVSPPSRPAKLEWDTNSSTEALDSLPDPLYGDNFASLAPFQSPSLGPTHETSVIGLYDTILYILVRLFHCNEVISRLMTSLRWIVADSFNHFAHFTIATKLQEVLTSGRIAHVIQVIEESIFEEDAPELTTEEVKARADLTLQMFRQYLPNKLMEAILQEKFGSGTETIFLALQDPLLNKQLAYTLLETLLVKLFPELKL